MKKRFSVYKFFTILFSLLISLLILPLVSSSQYFSQIDHDHNHGSAVLHSSGTTKSPVVGTSYVVRDSGDYLNVNVPGDERTAPIGHLGPNEKFVSYGNAPRPMKVFGSKGTTNTFRIRIFGAYVEKKAANQNYEYSYDDADNNVFVTDVRFYYFGYQTTVPGNSMGEMQFFELRGGIDLSYKLINEKNNEIHIQFTLNDEYSEFGIFPECGCADPQRCREGYCQPDCEYFFPGCLQLALNTCLYVSVTGDIRKKQASDAQSEVWARGVTSGLVPFYFVDGVNFDRIGTILMWVGIVLGVFLVIFLAYKAFKKRFRRFKIDVV